MKDLSKFQLILMGVFALALLGGVVAFALFRGGSGTRNANILVWGTINERTFLNLTRELNFGEEIKFNIEYREIEDEALDQTFLEELASGRGPDVLLISQDRILRHADKFFAIPRNVISEGEFKEIFIQGAEIFLTSRGTMAVPFSVDPLVMYWNRDSFTNANLSRPPTSWNQFYTMVPLLTEREGGAGIRKSGVAFGEFENVANAKQIISMLIMQAGNSIVERNPATDSVQSVLSAKTKDSVFSPAEAALNLFTEFSDARKIFYSWNRSLQNSQDMFTSGDLAIYFGFASENPVLRAKNPNLNFHVSRVPQAINQDQEVRITSGRFFGAAISRSSTDIQAALEFSLALASLENSQKISEAFALPPIRTDLLENKPTDAFGAVFFESALFARAWLEPDKNGVSDIFKTAVESITSGRARTSEAVTRAHNELSQLLNRFNFVTR